MASSTMTSKGQLTVPNEVRDALGLEAGRRVFFHRNADGNYLLSTQGQDMSAAFGILADAAVHEGTVTVDEMNDAIGGQIEREYRDCG